jgi:hypothetical protein
VATNTERISYPNRKISETFFAFAAPLLEAADANATKEQVEKALKIAFTVWNSVVYDTVNGKARWVSQIRQLAAKDPESSALMEMMITRKKKMFRDDLRLIGEYRLTRRSGEWHLWAEAREPRPKTN